MTLTPSRTLEFFEPDMAKFPCLNLAHEALRIGGSMTAVLNAANEIAVESFLQERISFASIPVVVEAVMEQHHPKGHPSLEDVLEADRWARERATESIAQITHSC
jgi:1-deoxy-D-xylulose-5-phosphate reductoisomerase